MRSLNQRDEVVLPVKYPIATSYMGLAPMLSILSSYKEPESWVYNHFVNLWRENLDCDYKHPLTFFSSNTIFCCPFLNNISLSSDIVHENYNGIVDLIMSSISLGYYVFFTYNQFYIPHCLHYQKLNNKHMLFVFGFNKLDKTFHVADFFYKNKYSFEKVSFEDLEKSVEGIIDNKWAVVRICKYVDYKYTFDVKLLKKSINDYLNSTHTVLNYETNILSEIERKNMCTGKMVFGLNNYELIIEYLSQLKKDDNITKDIRTFHALLDHKVMMLSRLTYLKENNLIENFDTLYNKFKKIKNYCKINRDLFIKYLLTSNNNILDRILDNIKIIVSEEKEAMLLLLNAFLI